MIRRAIAVTATGAILAPPFIYITDSREGSEIFDKSFGQIRARTEAALRAGNLASTVVIMGADYKLASILSKNPWLASVSVSPSSPDAGSSHALELAKKELSAAQLAQERAGIALELTKGRTGGAGRGRTDSKGQPISVPSSYAAALAACDDAKTRILAASEALMEEESKNGNASALHTRNAKRLISMARWNGGCYLKLAQHLSQLSHLLPPEYIEESITCLDDCPTSPLEDVRAVVREELGADPEDLFETFCPTPIASASLAQVHVAVEKTTGRKLAVKVQHRGLRETCRGDLDACSFAVHLVAQAFPSFELEWLVDEIAPHLPIELDFLQEAGNCRRAQEIFALWPDVVVPDVFNQYTAQRVLVMSFEEGINCTDSRRIERAGINTAAAAKLIGRSWLEQTFRHGVVHCDPHAGNVLVRPMKDEKGGSDPARRPQIVLLDHGLYKKIDDEFRLQYAEMWRSLIMADVPGIEAAARALGVGEHYPLFAAVLTQRPWDDIVSADIDSLRGGRGQADEAVIRAHAHKYLPEITQVLNRCPRQLLLLLKMMDCLRSLDRSLGATHNQHVATADVCCDALLAAELQAHGSSSSWLPGAPSLRVLWRWTHGKLRLRAYEAKCLLTASKKPRVDTHEK